MSVTGFNRRRIMIAEMRAKAEAEIKLKEGNTEKDKTKQISKKKAKEGAE